MNIKFMFILGTVAFILSLVYLGFWFALLTDDININKSLIKNKFNKLIIYCIFPIVSIITILCSIVYIYSLYKSIFIISLIIFFIILIILGLFLIFSEISDLGGFILLLGLLLFGVTIFTSNIKLEENEITKTITLYDQSIIRDDLSGIVINITSDVFKEKSYHTLMQYSVNDVKDFALPTSLYCTKFKFIDSQDNKLEIIKKEKIECGILYYHGFKISKPKTIDIEPIEYILYINQQNIIYE